jgi:hypothetical protein
VGEPDRRWTKPEQIDDLTAYHPPVTPGVAWVHEQIRDQVRALMHWLNETLPESPMKTTALNRALDVMHMANTVVAVVGNQDTEWRLYVDHQHIARQMYLERTSGAVAEVAENSAVTEMAERSEDAARRFASELVRLGEFLQLHYGPELVEGPIDTHAVDNAIRLLSSADSPAHRRAHETGAGADLLARLGTDGQKWAAEFVRLFQSKTVTAGSTEWPEAQVDEGTLLGWFANAIEAGRSAGYGEYGPRQRASTVESVARLREVAELAFATEVELEAKAVQQQWPTFDLRPLPDDATDPDEPAGQPRRKLEDVEDSDSITCPTTGLVVRGMPTVTGRWQCCGGTVPDHVVPGSEEEG